MPLPAPRAFPESAAPNPFISPLLKVCPECSGPLAHTSGCVTCLQCGWGRCG